MKTTNFYNYDHTKIIISDLDITPEECKISSNTFEQPSPCNIQNSSESTKLDFINRLIIK